MDTRGKSNTEFRSEVSEVLARHESSFDQIHATLQTILTDLQALKAQTNISTTGDVNPFAVGDASQTTKPYPQPRTPNSTLKLHFPKFTGEDPPDGFTKLNNTLNFKVLSLLNESSLLRSTSKELPSNGTVGSPNLRVPSIGPSSPRHYFVVLDQLNTRTRSKLLPVSSTPPQ
ncbi:hypothetical protein Acr_24g0004600 [Actinidia rufa]|uniref:Uncharacterized protein n=1 Tax=Actinidia rufa TaxID=165716 RepID=A0A7J0GTV6_9ERIC|nr:hypothetical protein Acr_24g0004600 [Actinidia rufa]